PYWNPAGDYEYHDTIYTIRVYTPKRPVPRFVPNILLRENKPAPRRFTIREREDNIELNCFRHGHLDDMKSKTVKIKAYGFPPELR
ncbi:hypothetical protein K458DRAFT_257183, partial [Lentithecium fluviatile CBS 122367]